MKNPEPDTFADLSGLPEIADFDVDSILDRDAEAALFAKLDADAVVWVAELDALMQELHQAERDLLDSGIARPL
jgi:hypothetical protein